VSDTLKTVEKKATLKETFKKPFIILTSALLLLGIGVWFLPENTTTQTEPVYERVYGEVMYHTTGLCTYTEPGLTECPRLGVLIPYKTTQETETIREETEEKIVIVDRPGGLGNDPFEIKVGDRIVLGQWNMLKGTEWEADSYFVLNKDTRNPLLSLLVLFTVVLVFLARSKGVRALLGLGLSSVMLLFVLIPLLERQVPPILVAVLGGGLTLLGSMLIVHGVNRKTLEAYIAACSGLVVAGILSSIYFAGLKVGSYDSFSSMISNITNSFPNSGMLLAGAGIIAVMGILDDIAITQIMVVEELYTAQKESRPNQVFKAAMRVGTEHVAAGANTLLFAVVGASLPLILASSQGGYGFGTLTGHGELTAAVFIGLIGSVALMTVVPVASIIAAYSRHPDAETEK